MTKTKANVDVQFSPEKGVVFLLDERTIEISYNNEDFLHRTLLYLLVRENL